MPEGDASIYRKSGVLTRVHQLAPIFSIFEASERYKILI